MLFLLRTCLETYLSDEASMITGSIGMLSSASLGKTKLGLI